MFKLPAQRPAENAVGLLKEELRRLDSLILRCADGHRVGAGGALAVDRQAFAAAVTEAVRTHPDITVIEEEVTNIPEQGTVVIATGPLTSDALAAAVGDFFPESRYLNFYDAAAPLVTFDSVDMDRAFFRLPLRQGRAGLYQLPHDPGGISRFPERALQSPAG